MSRLQRRVDETVLSFVKKAGSAIRGGITSTASKIAMGPRQATIDSISKISEEGLEGGTKKDQRRFWKALTGEDSETHAQALAVLRKYQNNGIVKEVNAAIDEIDQQGLDGSSDEAFQTFIDEISGKGTNSGTKARAEQTAVTQMVKTSLHESASDKARAAVTDMKKANPRLAEIASFKIATLRISK